VSKEILREIDNLCRSTALNTCWRQWSAVGAPVSSLNSGAATAIVDPEALLLLSSAFRNQERRLDDVLSWWCRAGSKLVSVQRTRSLLRLFPEDLQLSVSSFARAAYERGDRRWKTLETTADSLSARELKGAKEPSLLEPAALILRLRSGLGLSMKSDLLAMLIGMRGSSATIRQMTEALGYSKMALSVATREMTRSGLLKETPSRPAGYFVHSALWEKLLGFESVYASGEPKNGPAWHCWFQLFAFLSHVSLWVRTQPGNLPSRYVLSSQVRDLYYRHEKAFALNSMSVPNPEQHRGATYLEAFRLTLEHVSDWTQDNV